MSMEWIRKNYSVPAKRGGRVEYTPLVGAQTYLGTITHATHHIWVRMDGFKRSSPYHPTWGMRYLDAGRTALSEAEGGK